MSRVGEGVKAEVRSKKTEVRSRRSAVAEQKAVGRRRTPESKIRLALDGEPFGATM